MKLNLNQKAIVYGLVLGDGYVQSTGKKNARLRIEHSVKQTAYVNWKYKQLENLFAHKPKKVVRKHPSNQQSYSYLRLQSHSSPWFGKLRQQFYANNKKIIPDSISTYISSPLSLAVWYMDDGYYYQRDKSAHIYLPAFGKGDISKLIKALKEKHNLNPGWYCRPDKKSCQLNFTGKNKDKLFTLISPYIIEELKYKISLDPVTTEDEN